MSLTDALLLYQTKIGDPLDVHFEKEALRLLAAALMEIELSTTIAATPYERTDTRQTYRNGYRRRLWKTSLGSIKIEIPKLRTGSYFPDFLDENEMEAKLLEIIHDAYAHERINHNEIVQLLNDLAITDADESTIIDSCQSLEGHILRFRQRSIHQSFSIVWLDVIDSGDSSEQIAVVVGLDGQNQYHLLDFKATPHAATDDDWRELLKRVQERGLKSVDVVISDAYSGIERVIADELAADWQYSTAHFLNTLTQHIPEQQQQDIIYAVSQLFALSNREQAESQLVGLLRTIEHDWPSMSTIADSVGKLFTFFDHQLLMPIILNDEITYLNRPALPVLLHTKISPLGRLDEAANEIEQPLSLLELPAKAQSNWRP